MKQEKQKTYWVIIEPKDESIAWFYLGKDGQKEYKNTVNLDDWDHIPTQDEIKALLSSLDIEYSYYVVEATPSNDFSKAQIKVVAKGEITKEMDMEIEQN